MTQNSNKAFRDALDRFVHIGNVHYNGKHFDNVHNIFNDLDISDQKSLLIGVYFLFSVMENGVVQNTNTPDVKPKPEVLEKNNSKSSDHQTELKIWFIKMFVIFSTLCLFILVLSVLIIGGTNTHDNESFLGNLFKVLMLFT